MSGSIARVEVLTLGRFQVLKDGSPLSFPAKAQRKPLALLKLLIAMGGREVAEQSLTDALWPESDGDAAHRTFASTLHRLRELTGHECLLLRDRRLSLVEGTCRVDALEIPGIASRKESACHRGDADDAARESALAVTLYRGPFLDGEFDPPEILAARSRLHSQFLRVITGCAEFLSEAGRAELAVHLYRRGLEVDGTAEELCLGLMRALQRQGRQAETLAAFAAFQTALQAGGGADPSPETRALAESLRPSAPEMAALKAETLSAPLARDSGLEGKREPPLTAAATRPPWRMKIAAIASVAALVLASGTLVWIAKRANISEQDFPGFGGASETFKLPSIAVLPFAKLSGDPAQDYFADGITDDIITDLSSLRGLLVIARESTFRFKNQRVDIREIAGQLNVRYVLEGSVRRSDGQVRISAQLIDSSNATHIWADRYDRPLTDIFTVQDEITSTIVKALEISLVEGEQNRILRSSTVHPEAYDLGLKGRNHMLMMSKKTNNLAREELGRAVMLDPDYQGALLFLGWTHFQDFQYGWNDFLTPEQSIGEAEKLAHRLVELDPDSGDAFSLLGGVAVARHRFEEAIRYGERGVELHPNSAKTNGLLSFYLCSSDHYEDGLARMRYALRLNPLPPAWMPSVAAQCALSLHRYEEALQDAKRSSLQAPEFIEPLLFQVVSLVGLGRMAEARAVAEVILRIDPRFDVKQFVETGYPSKNPGTPAGWIESARKAGLR